MTAEEQAFRAYSTRRLRRAGLGGKLVVVALDTGGVTFTGETGQHRLPLMAIKRMRTGYVDAKGGPYWETVLWPIGEPSIKLSPTREEARAYAAFVRGLAAQVAAARGIAAVESGLATASALYFPVAIGLLFLAALGIGAFVLEEDPWYQRWAPAVIPGLLLGLLLWLFQKVHRPRPAKALSDLDRQLPH